MKLCSTREKKPNDLAEWYAAQYDAGVGLADVEGGARFKTFVSALPAETVRGTDSFIPITGRQRMSSFLSLKLRYPLGPDGYSCVALVAALGDTTAHYGYAYWRRGQESAAAPEYICVSPTFESRDGEYRRRFIRGTVFLAAYESLVDDLTPFEEAVVAMTASGDLRLTPIAYPEEDDAARVTSAAVAAARLPILAFSVALALDLWRSRRRTLMIHTSRSHVNLMAAISKMYPDLAESCPNVSLNVFKRGVENSLSVQCGQKLVPMFTREAMQVLDYNLAAWRELAVSRLVSDLVLNFVSPSFAIYNQWTYIEGADAALFENPAMEERYARGAVAAVASHSLREARRKLGDAEVNYHTEGLSAHVYESLEYAQSYLLMSPVALAHTMEDVGWSMGSLEDFVRRTPASTPAAADAFATPDAAARHLFELAYAAHCLHTKAGVAHTDLHSNNMTLYAWGRSAAWKKGDDGAAVYTPYYDDPVVVYVAGPRGEADTYIFPAAGDSACIIDYSRCILGPAFRPRLEAGRSAQYATNFYRDQVNRVMRALHRYAPEYVAAHQNAIKAAVLANFEAVFPILCAVDFIAIGSNLGTMLEGAAQPLADELRSFKVDSAAVKIARRLEDAGRELLITGLHDLAESAGARRQMRTPEFPGAALLERVFGEWLFPRWAARDPRRARASAQLVDAYNYNNELRYSGEDYTKYPPWARLDEIERHLGEYKLTDLFERGVEPFLEALRPGARVEVIAEQIRVQQEKLNGRPVSTASSWIDE
jgi:hypothetical protein